MKPTKWRDLSDEEMQHQVRGLTEELFNLRFQLAMGLAKNPARVRQARRDIARGKTILRERRSTRRAGG
jgi:large subunit ribosomal protein L29